MTGDTLVYTDEGLRRAADLHKEQEGKRVAVDGRMKGGRFNPASAVFSSGLKPVYRLRTQEGYEVRLTRDHRVMTEDGWVPAGDLEPGQRIHILDQGSRFGEHGSLEMGQTLGWLIGDGTLKGDRAVMSFFGRKRELAPAFAGRMNELVPKPTGRRKTYTIGVVELEPQNESRVSSSRFLKVAAEYGLLPGNKHHVPEKVFTGTRQMQAGFLQGIFSADGHVNQFAKQGSRVHLTSISREMLIDVQRLLLNFGIASRIYFDRRPAGTRELPDGQGGSREYNTKAYHELVISRHNLLLFQEDIGFMDEFKRGLLDTALESYGKTPGQQGKKPSPTAS